MVNANPHHLSSIAEVGPPDQGNRSPKNWVAIVSVLSLLAPVSYLVGFYYEGGYLRAYGLTQDIFTRPSQEYMANSFGALAVLFEIVAPSLEFAAYKKWLLVCAGIGVYALAFTQYLKWAELAVRRFSLMNKLSQHIRRKSTVAVILSGTLLLLVPILLVFILTFLLLPAYVAEGFGNKSAYKEIHAFKGCENTTKKSSTTILGPESCVSVYNGDKLIAQGKIIASSEKYLALFNGERSMIMSIKPETIIVRPFFKK